MATLASLRTEITNKLSDGSLQEPTSSQITDQINSAISFYNPKKFRFLQKVTNITLNQGDPLVPNMPSDFLAPWEPNGVVIPYQNANYVVKKKTNLEYDSMNLQGLGIPFAYTMRAGSMYLYFYPNTTYTLQLTYNSLMTALVNDSDTNVFLTNNNAYRLILAKTIADIYIGYRRDFEMGNLWEDRAKLELQSLLDQEKAYMATGYLTTEIL